MVWEHKNGISKMEIKNRVKTNQIEVQVVSKPVKKSSLRFTLRYKEGREVVPTDALQKLLLGRS